jgi:hypothetical protein
MGCSMRVFPAHRVELGRQLLGGRLCHEGGKDESKVITILASGPASDSAAWRHEHEYVNTTTRWDNYPLQKDVDP